MAVAYWMFHAPASFYPVLNGRDAAILYTFVFLLFVFTGPGAFSVDGVRRKSLDTSATRTDFGVEQQRPTRRAPFENP